MGFTTLIGLIAATCTTGSFLPQAIKVIRTKNTKDLSLGMYSLFVIGISFWLMYGILLKEIPIILANVVGLVFTSTILCLIIKYN